MKRLQSTRAKLSVVDIILLSIRILLGAMLISYGFWKLLWWVAVRERLGSNMAILWFTEWFAVWWFLAMFAEFFGWILLILWLFTRVSSFLVSFTFVIILLVQWQRVWQDPTTTIALSKFVEIAFYLYASIFFTVRWASKMSLDNRFGLCPIDKYCSVWSK